MPILDLTRCAALLMSISDPVKQKTLCAPENFQNYIELQKQTITEYPYTQCLPSYEHLGLGRQFMIAILLILYILSEGCNILQLQLVVLHSWTKSRRCK